MSIQYTEYQLQDEINDATQDILTAERSHRGLQTQIKTTRALPVTPSTAQQVQALQDRRDALEKQIPVLVTIRDALTAQLP